MSSPVASNRIHAPKFKTTAVTYSALSIRLRGVMFHMSMVEGIIISTVMVIIMITMLYSSERKRQRANTQPTDNRQIQMVLDFNVR